ncbi:HNH endonuclease signature motif containing protein [Mangrovibacterium sp.]|uniref:HNH endonuclease signature motif containing protein n=1 Tax=Mangrovibacterium sp. TaxID=1961364 RepID=UPI003569B26B
MSKPKSRVDDPRVKVYKNGLFYYHFLNKERLHRIYWTEKHGPIPEGMLLVCKSGDTMNPHPDNWELMTPQDHLKKMRENVRNQDNPVEIRCSKCGKQIKISDRTRRLCDDCRIQRSITYTKTCAECGTQFQTTRKRTVTCSEACTKKRSYHKTYESFKRQKQKQKQKPVKTSSGDRRGVETVPVDQMFELNRNAPKHDREIIERKGIESPDLSQMEYKVYDPALRITRYFRSKERYEKFLKTKKQEA